MDTCTRPISLSISRPYRLEHSRSFLRRAIPGDLTASPPGAHWRIISAKLKPDGRLRADLSTCVFALDDLPSVVTADVSASSSPQPAPGVDLQIDLRRCPICRAHSARYLANGGQVPIARQLVNLDCDCFAQDLVQQRLGRRRLVRVDDAAQIDVGGLAPLDLGVGAVLALIEVGVIASAGLDAKLRAPHVRTAREQQSLPIADADVAHGSDSFRTAA